MARHWLGLYNIGQPRSRERETADILRAALARLEMTFELMAFKFGERVQGIRTTEGVQVVEAPFAALAGTCVAHSDTPKQSRSRMSPSRIRVLIVPSGTPSVAPTSAYVNPW